MNQVKMIAVEMDAILVSGTHFMSEWISMKIRWINTNLNSLKLKKKKLNEIPSKNPQYKVI